MSGDEALVLFLSLGAGGIAWMVWFWRAAFTARRCSRFSQRWPLLLYPLLCAAALYAVLRLYSSFDMRDSPLYLAFYMVLGAMWVRLGSWFLPLLGLSARDDVIERGNAAAAQAIGGALLGLTLCFAGGNIGDGLHGAVPGASVGEIQCQRCHRRLASSSSSPRSIPLPERTRSARRRRNSAL